MDLDADGHPDILSGSYSRMEEPMAGLFQVLYGKPDGTFREAKILNGTDGKPLMIPLSDRPGQGVQWTDTICTRPFAVDWDGDGKLDLVVGNFAGTFHWFNGEGKGKFRPRAEVLKAGGAPLQINGNHSDPFVIDWDGDGALDLVSGSSDGGVQWAKNRAPKGKPPQFTGFEWLIKPSRQREDEALVSEKDLTGPAEDTRVWVADINGDGKLDLLVGDSVTLRSPAKGLSVADYKRKLAAWRKKLEAAADKNALTNKEDETKRTKTIESIQKIYSQRDEFMEEHMTGFVWLYLHK